MSTTALVRKTISIKDNLEKVGKGFDQYWVAFDKDDDSDKDFNDAILLAQKNGFRVAYSNQDFEYWFVLHYKKYEGHYSRVRLCLMLTKLAGIEYTKKSDAASSLFAVLYPKQRNVIENAKSVQKEISNGNPAQEESSTTVCQHSSQQHPKGKSGSRIHLHPFFVRKDIQEIHVCKDPPISVSGSSVFTHTLLSKRQNF